MLEEKKNFPQYDNNTLESLKFWGANFLGLWGFYSLGYNFMDAWIFIFSKKIFKIWFYGGWSWATNEYRKNWATTTLMIPQYASSSGELCLPCISPHFWFADRWSTMWPSAAASLRTRRQTVTFWSWDIYGWMVFSK